MAEVAALDWKREPSYRVHRRPLDPKALALAALLTALLIALIASIGLGFRHPVATAPLLAVFDIPPPAPAQDDDTPPPNAPDSEQLSATRDEPAPQPAPQSAPLAAPDLPIFPLPQIQISPVELPEIMLAGPARALTQGSDLKGRGEGGDGSGVDGAGGAGQGGDGSGGSGRRSKLSARWAPEMRLSQLKAYFPDAARASGNGGVGLVKCFALKNHRMRDCSIVGEYPAGLGFGAAAVASEPILRVQVRDQNGKRVFDTWVLFYAEFRHPVTGNKKPK